MGGQGSGAAMAMSCFTVVMGENWVEWMGERPAPVRSPGDLHTGGDVLIGVCLDSECFCAGEGSSVYCELVCVQE